MRINPVHSVEVYLPWNNTWLELPPLPVLPYQHQEYRMDETRIFSINRMGSLNLYLLGGTSVVDSGGGLFSRSVWRLEWLTSNNSYHWTLELDPPLGELH